MKTLWREHRSSLLCCFTHFSVLQQQQIRYYSCYLPSPLVPVARCLGDCHRVMCCWGVVACRKRGLCFSLDDMLTGDYIFRNVLLKKPRQTPGLQTVTHSTFVDIIPNPSFPDFNLSHVPKHKFCHLNTCRNHTETWGHSCTPLCT